MTLIFDKKLILFGGKGGVGKTSMAAATGIRAASMGKKVLVLSTDPAHSLSDSFDTIIGDQATKISENLFAMELNAIALLGEYKKKYGPLIQQIANEGTFFSKDDIQRFFDLSLPGLDELMALLEVIDILAKNEYDLLILDTAPTGHTIRLLEMPQVMEAFIRVMVEMRKKHRVVVSMMVGRYSKDKADEYIDAMYNDIQKVKAILQNTAHTEFIPVLIPETMVMKETEMFVSVLEEHKVPITRLIVNQVIQHNCACCTSRAENQQAKLKSIRDVFNKYTIREIPFFDCEVRGNELQTLANALYDESFQYPLISGDRLLKTSLEAAPNTPPNTPLKKDDSRTNESLIIAKTTEFLLLGGKGGVGKTTCAAAVALHESTSRNVLLFSTDPAHSLSDVFGKKIGNTLTPIRDNLDALEINAHSLLEALKRKYRQEIHAFFSSVFKSTATATIDAPYDRKVMESLFDLCPPGIDELMALKTMMDLMNEKTYDLFILDTAPTGHAIRLLEMPELAEQWLKTLLDIQDAYPLSLEIGDTLNDMLATVTRLQTVLTNPQKSEFVIVAIPEAMSVLETRDLVASLKELTIQSGQMIINKRLPQSSCGFCSKKRLEQDVHAAELATLGLKTISVELFPTDIQAIGLLQELSRKLYGE